MKNILSSLENYIIKLAGTDPFENLRKDPSISAHLKTLLADRCSILNEMFVPTDSNMQRFIWVNNHLYTLTKKLYHRVNQIKKQLPLITNPGFDDDYELEGHLTIPFYDENYTFYLNQYYGSNFAQMTKCLAAVYPESVLHVSPNQMPLDDGATWDEGPFQQHPQFNDIIICYAVHDICTHRPYSIPDLLCLHDFDCEVQLTLQHIVSTPK